jgi:hypothetical protein
VSKGTVEEFQGLGKSGNWIHTGMDRHDIVWTKWVIRESSTSW